VWIDPPDEAGDEVLHIVSERRSLKMKGHAFREFHKLVVPLLDGRHTLEEIQASAGDVFRPEDLGECLDVLGGQGVIVEADIPAPHVPAAERMAPQLNLFRDLAPGLDLQARLTRATVAVLGLGGAGTATAMALGSAGVGTVRCVDWLSLTPTDIYWSPFLGADRVGENRAEAAARAVRSGAPEVSVPVDAGALDSEDDIRRAIGGADYAVCCLDSSQSNLIFKLNRVCLADGVRWCAGSSAGIEITAGPAFQPGASPCYVCYRMRAVACAGNPEEAFAYEKYLDRRRRDDSATRESLVFGAGLVANLVGLEVVKTLTGIAEPSLVGRIVTIRLSDLAIERHTVLRKPWCPACFAPAEPGDAL
jgi:adenylyltransferase/sulfurtransferase